jgi:Glycosyltransferase family 10 (fucosyltransferase) C-term
MDTKMNKIELYIKDSNFAHCIFSNNPTPPVSIAKHVIWNRSDAPPGVDVVCTDYQLEKGNIAWLLEPQGIHPFAYEYVKNNPHRYKQIWTHDKEYLSLPNAKWYPVGGCWIPVELRQIYEKSKMFSIIASNKNQLPGHQLRHQIIHASGKNIDAFGPSYKQFIIHSMNKIEGLKDYRFHFAIENCKKDFYFTEKLIDCLMTGTIPIYWGCPSIEKFFNIDGFVIFNDMYDLKDKLKTCTPDFYNSKKAAIEENFKLAQNYILSEDWIYNNILNKNEKTV